VKPNEFITGDTHFGHAFMGRQRKLDAPPHPLGPLAAMDAELVRRWNAKVPPKALVYHVGDFCFGNKRRVLDLLDQLHGRICLLRGNHDRIVRGGLANAFEWVKDYHESKTEDGTKVVMCHYAFKVWNKSHYGSWCVHGHSHGSLDNSGVRRMDVGVDAHPNLEPFSCDEVESYMQDASRRAPRVDHHGARP
jgi:calcineurin-like phosphoesterase family protein